MNIEKDKWTDWLLVAPFWYVPAGFLFFHWSKDDSIPMWGWAVAYVLSPLIAGVLGLIGYTMLAVFFVILIEFSKKK